MPNDAPYIFLAPPPVELLLFLDHKGYWPHAIVYSEKLRKQAEDRLFLSQTLRLLFDHMGNLEIAEAIDAGMVNPEDATTAYQKLARFLETDFLHKRLVLYLPFELIPHRLWKHKSAALENAVRHFKQIYIRRWEKLLYVADVRANFVDGDVPEPELRTSPVPRVVKAAHLIPMLAAKSLISVQQVLEIMAKNLGGVLEESVLDTMQILADLKLMSYEQAAKLIKRYVKKAPASPSAISPKRARWLKQEEEKKLVEKMAQRIRQEILHSDPLSPARLEEMRHDGITALAVVHGIRMAIEAIACMSLDDARTKYLEYEKTLLDCRNRDISAVGDAITSMWSRLLHLNVLGQEDIERLDIFIHDFEARFTGNKKLIERDVEKLRPTLKRLYHDPNLAQLFYPVCIIFGSRVKGYGTSTADLDIAVFVRPGVSFDERPTLQKCLEELFSHEKVRGKVMEFWLEQKGEELTVRDFKRPDTRLGDSMLAHVLFGGAWYGEEQAIRELYAKLLSGYLYARDDEKRKIWLEELERDTLLYRLLHKGYARFFPEQGGIRTAHADWIEGNSMFYDSGYRRLATKLFIKKVFLPELI